MAQIKTFIEPYTAFGYSFAGLLNYELLIARDSNYKLNNFGEYSTGGRVCTNFNKDTIAYRVTLNSFERDYIKEILQGNFDEQLPAALLSCAQKAILTAKYLLLNKLCTEIVVAKLIQYLNAQGQPKKIISLSKEELKQLFKQVIKDNEDTINKYIENHSISHLANDRLPIDYLEEDKYCRQKSRLQQGIDALIEKDDISLITTFLDNRDSNIKPVIIKLAYALPSCKLSQEQLKSVTVLLQQKYDASGQDVSFINFVLNEGFIIFLPVLMDGMSSSECFRYLTQTYGFIQDTVLHRTPCAELPVILEKLTPKHLFDALTIPNRDGYMPIEKNVNNQQFLEFVIPRLKSEQLLNLFNIKNREKLSKLASTINKGYNSRSIFLLISEHISEDHRELFLNVKVDSRLTIGDLLSLNSSPSPS